MSEDVEKLKKQIKNPDKEFVVNAVSREDLFYMLGHDEDAVNYINSLSDEEIQEAINSMEYNEYRDELWEKLMKIIDRKQEKWTYKSKNKRRWNEGK